MEPLNTSGGSERGEEKIQYPTSVHPVKPIHDAVDRPQSQLEKVISAYDHIIDTAVAQLQLLESVESTSPAPVSAPSRTVPASKQSSKAAVASKAPARSKTAAAATKPNSSQPSVLDTNFTFKWPSDLKYPINIAVKVNAENIPATPWIFRRIFGPAVHVHLHKHSSLKGTFPDLVNDNAREYKLDEIKIIFTVIVHGIDQLEFIVDPLRQGTIRDEHNLQRYLLRTLKMLSPMDPVLDASSENYVDIVGRGLLQKQSPTFARKTLGSMDNAVRGGRLLLRPSQPTPADLSLLAASYEHDLRDFSGIQSFRSNLETYFEVKDDGEDWFTIKKRS